MLSVVDYGPSGPLLWFKAKFLNEPAGAPGSPSKPPANLPPEASGPANARQPSPGFPNGVPTPGFSPTPIK